jgi:hypothetical protein
MPLPLDRAHSQKMSCEISILKWDDRFGCRIHLRAVEQPKEALKVTVQLFHSHKELPNWNPVWLLQSVRDVELDHLSCIGAEYRLKVECHAIQEGGPGFPCLLVMHLTTEVFLGNSVGLSLHNLLPGLAHLISEKIPI